MLKSTIKTNIRILITTTSLIPGCNISQKGTQKYENYIKWLDNTIVYIGAVLMLRDHHT